ncbi:hypothetical protein ACHHYP_11728 [Achlya hypogyna]|uniref:SAP domain-containing protein n=1 Tax=Achlya hypogyna TaxID=1202772 RepID=A0A1V9YIM3_ACHHY|nr:hypothetical protein ACHHYP_11728 [Achlya hypogyna]
MADTDHIRTVQGHLQRGEKDARTAIEGALKVHLTWLTSFGAAARTELRRPSVNGKKRRLVLDLASDAESEVETNAKRPKPNEIAASVDKPAAKSVSRGNPVPKAVKSSKQPIVIESSSDSESSDDDNDGNASVRSVASVVVDPSKLKVPELRKALSDRNLSTFGLKAKLVQRLAQAIQTEQAAKPPSVVDDDDEVVPFIKAKPGRPRGTRTASAKPEPTAAHKTEPVVTSSSEPEIAPVQAIEPPSPKAKTESPVREREPEPHSKSSPVRVPSNQTTSAASSPIIAYVLPNDSFVDETPLKSPERPVPVLHSPGKVRSKEPRKRKTLFPAPPHSPVARRAVDFDDSSLGTAPPSISSLKLAERNRAAELKRAAEKQKRKEALMKKYEEQRKADEEKRRKVGLQQTEEADRLRREREAAERRQREAEVARKRAARLQEIQAATEEKKRALERSDKQRQDRPKVEIAKPLSKVEIAKPLTKAKPADGAGAIKKPLKPEVTTYQMSEPESDESDAGDEITKAVPKWAQKENLERALARQFGPHAVDPTPGIFPEFIATCDLEAIFQPRDGAKKKKFARRTSSGNWLADKPTTREKLAYKKAMGYTN